MEGFKKKERVAELNETEKAFLEQRYLQEKYLIPGDIAEALRGGEKELAKNFSGFFNSLIVVGGVANGSLAFRKLTESDPSTDLDYYLVGYDGGEARLRDMSEETRRAMKPVALTIDPALNGENPDNFLNLSHIEQHIDSGDFDLLALPFTCSFGDAVTARRAVLSAIMARENSADIWAEVKNYHDQSLSMHHGKWSDGLNDIILKEYLPKKIERFGLPEKPEDVVIE
jgi:hypothetical protein